MIPAILGGLAIGAQIIGGAQQASAAGKAARAQENAAREQLDFYRQMYADQQQQSTPYREASNIALSQYMAELGLPPIQAAMPGQVQQVAPQAQATQAAQTLQPTLSQADFSTVGGNAFIDKMGRAYTYNEMQQAIQNSASQAQQTQTAAPVQQPAGQAAPQYFQPTVTNQLTPADQWQIDESIKAAQIAAGGKLGGREFRAISERAGGLALQNRENRLNRLANLAGTTATLTQNAQSLQQGLGGQMGQAMGNVGAARSSGYINQSNALSGTLQGLGQLASFGAGQGWFGGGGFAGTPSPGLSPGAMPLHIPTNPFTRGY